jgi:arylsulfatase A-like enzyme
LTQAKQLELGIIPKGTRLTVRPESIPSWDSRSADEKKVYGRLMENYAGYMEYTDAEVGRYIESLAASGELENTLVMYVVGDNGASAEGGLEGTFSRPLMQTHPRDATSQRNGPSALTFRSRLRSLDRGTTIPISPSPTRR